MFLVGVRWRDSRAGYPQRGLIQRLDAHYAAVARQPDSLDIRHSGWWRRTSRRWRQLKMTLLLIPCSNKQRKKIEIPLSLKFSLKEENHCPKSFCHLNSLQLFLLSTLCRGIKKKKIVLLFSPLWTQKTNNNNFPLNFLLPYSLSTVFPLIFYKKNSCILTRLCHLICMQSIYITLCQQPEYLGPIANILPASFHDRNLQKKKTHLSFSWL